MYYLSNNLVPNNYLIRFSSCGNNAYLENRAFYCKMEKTVSAVIHIVDKRVHFHVTFINCIKQTKLSCYSDFASVAINLIKQPAETAP